MCNTTMPSLLAPTALTGPAALLFFVQEKYIIINLALTGLSLSLCVFMQKKKKYSKNG